MCSISTLEDMKLSAHCWDRASLAAITEGVEYGGHFDLFWAVHQIDVRHLLLELDSKMLERFFKSNFLNSRLGLMEFSSRTLTWITIIYIVTTNIYFWWDIFIFQVRRRQADFIRGRRELWRSLSSARLGHFEASLCRDINYALLMRAQA